MKISQATHLLTQLFSAWTLLSSFDGPGNGNGPTSTLVFVDAYPREVQDVDYEVWGADQSNSVEGQTSLGVKGGFLWVWNKTSIETQIDGGPDAVPMGCTPSQDKGPCDLFDIFPTSLEQVDSNNVVTATLGDLDGVGRWHGIRRDPTTNKYVLANIFTRGGGYVGIIDTRTKEAVALFRVTKFAFTKSKDGGDRSVHMSFWSTDGKNGIIANLHGKAVERINIERDAQGNITAAYFDKSASLGLGKGMSVVESATYFKGTNAYGRDLVGGVTGNYEGANLDDKTPNGKCKENDCGVRSDNGAAGGRANNLPICPVPGQDGTLYITLAGGGLLIGDTTSTPMRIVGEYGRNIVYGAGCSGVEVINAQKENKMYIDSGISASSAGATQSNFAIWEFDNTDYLTGESQPENFPVPVVVFEDVDGNTATLGNENSEKPSINDGQLPDQTVRRDSHGATPTFDGKYVHTVDRIQGEVYVFNTVNLQGRFEYSLRTSGVCEAYSVEGDGDLPLNDPAPDLTESTPDGKYVAIAFRGPAPVSVAHSAQGSCPGVGIVRLTKGGKSGELVTVLRSTNTVEDVFTATGVTVSGGINYKGTERSDVHDTTVIDKSQW